MISAAMVRVLGAHYLAELQTAPEAVQRYADFLAEHLTLAEIRALHDMVRVALLRHEQPSPATRAG